MLRLESEELIVEIDELGAQMRSIFLKGEKIEFLWQRNSAYWSSSAPVPFPIIGRLNENKTEFFGKSYSMKSNGIIRYEKIPIIFKSKNKVEFLFVNTEETRKCYPFECRVKICFEVINNKVIIKTTIINDDENTMYYNYAGHPGINIPWTDGETSNDYYVEFEQTENLEVYKMSNTGQLLPETEPFLDQERRFFIRKNLFKNEALVFKHPISKSISLKSLSNFHQVKLDFNGFDNLAFWSPYQNNRDLKFICIEPWVGHSDFMGNKLSFSQKDEVASLKMNEQKSYIYSIELL